MTFAYKTINTMSILISQLIKKVCLKSDVDIG